MRNRLGVTIAAFAALLTMGARAEAAPITGSITFGGVIAPTDFTTTNSINVVNDLAVVTCAQLSLCTGSYAPLNGNVINATYHDFTFNPLPAGGVTPLWTFTFPAGTTYAFNLLAISSIQRSASGILITGTGLATKTGLNNTNASWSFSADQTGQFAFSSTTSTIPDGGTTSALLGGALLGLGMLRRRLGSKG